MAGTMNMARDAWSSSATAKYADYMENSKTEQDWIWAATTEDTQAQELAAMLKGRLSTQLTDGSLQTWLAGQAETPQAWFWVSVARILAGAVSDGAIAFQEYAAKWLAQNRGSTKAGK